MSRIGSRGSREVGKGRGGNGIPATMLYLRFSGGEGVLVLTCNGDLQRSVSSGQGIIVVATSCYLFATFLLPFDENEGQIQGFQAKSQLA